MKLIATTVGVDSEKKTERLDSTTLEENALGMMSHVDGTRTMTLSVSIEFAVYGNMQPYWDMKKEDRDLAIAANLLNRLNMFEL